MNAVVPFDPKNGQRLENIPHMLRYWADALESGREPTPDTALLVLVQGGDTPPEFCIFGAEPSRMALGGVFLTCANLAVATEQA